MSPRIAIALTAGSVLLVAGGALQPAGDAGRPGLVASVGTAATASAYIAPVGGAIVVERAFERPAGPYAAGHRGVDLVVGGVRAVRSPQAGRVSFAGSVAGRGVVVIMHADGIRTEYEPVIAQVRAGALLRRGQLFATVSGQHGSCVMNGCLHWGAERSGEYFDPMSLLGALGTVRLLPWTGQD